MTRVTLPGCPLILKLKVLVKLIQFEYMVQSVRKATCTGVRDEETEVQEARVHRNAVAKLHEPVEAHLVRIMYRCSTNSRGLTSVMQSQNLVHFTVSCPSGM